MGIFREANSLYSDMNSLYEETNAYMTEANSFCQQLNLNDESQIKRMHEYMNGIFDYLKKTKIYHKRISFYRDKFVSAGIPSDLNETQKNYFMSQTQSLNMKGSSNIEQIDSLIEKLNSFIANANNILNSYRSENMDEMNSNLNGNSPYPTETNSHETNVKSRCCILI